VRQPAANGGPHQPPVSIVDRDDWLADRHAVRKGHDPFARMELRVYDKSRHEPGVQRTDVTDGVPHVLGACGRRNLFSDRSHDQNLRLLTADGD